MRRRALNLCITAGDPAGIGPEVALRAINALNDESIIPVLVGRKAVLQKNHADLFVDYQIISPESPTPGEWGSGANGRTLKPGKKYLCDIALDLPVPDPGAGSAGTGREALACVDAAIGLWKAGAIDAVVTGPVSKALIGMSGVNFTGHTEYIAGKTGGDPLMMMFSEKYRVLLASTHVPVSEIMRCINRGRLLQVIRAGYEAIRSIDPGGPVKLAITGLDPHCGDDGAIGGFDREVTAGAVADARAAGVPIEGPFAADTLFIPSTWERYNLVIAHYHDQGLIPFKMLAFDRGVNVTLGLPLVRTSVDHGTAFDIAGKNVAGWNSMTEAILLAKRLVETKER